MLTRPTFAGELFALVDRCDCGIALAVQIQDILASPTLVGCIEDSRTVRHVVVRMGVLTERRLSVDAACLKAAHLSDDMNHLYWVQSENNAANVMTNFGVENEVFDPFLDNSLVLNPTAWVERELRNDFVPNLLRELAELSRWVRVS